MRLRTKSTDVEVHLEDGATVTLRPASVSESNRLLEEHTKTKHHRGTTREVVNRPALALALWLRQVRSWSKVNDEEGKPLACDEANKRTAWNHNPEWCAEVLEIMEATRAEQQKDEAGNLPGAADS